MLVFYILLCCLSPLSRSSLFSIHLLLYCIYWERPTVFCCRLISLQPLTCSYCNASLFSIFFFFFGVAGTACPCKLKGGGGWSQLRRRQKSVCLFKFFGSRLEPQSRRTWPPDFLPFFPATTHNPAEVLIPLFLYPISHFR